MAQVRVLDQARVAAEVGGRIIELPVRVGQTVTQGSVLSRLDDTDYRIALERAQAQAGLVEARLGLAEVQLEQARSLSARGFTSADGLHIRETELAVLRGELAVARQALSAAKVQLTRSVVRAPFDGVVSARQASVGDYASPGQVLVTLASQAGTELHANVPVAQLDSLLKSNDIQFWVDGQPFDVQVLRVVPLVEAAGQMQLVVLDGADDVPPGRAGELRWRDSVAYLPASFVVERGGQTGVWLERDGQPVFHPVPNASPGRPVALDMPLDVRVVDQGRLTLGLTAAPIQLLPGD